MSALRTMETVEWGIPRIPLGGWIEDIINWVKSTFRWFFNFIADVIEAAVNGLTDLLQWPPVLVTIVILAAIAWLVRDWKLALGSVVGLLFIVSVDQWDNAMATLSLVLVAALVALVIGIPLGILSARSETVSRVVRPVLDLMQTMPAFVWLIPTVMLFGLGVPAGTVATIVFALPPGVRLTELGIRQVDAEVVEAGQAFGGTPRQILGGIQMPLAMPTIMAGVNQVIMLALSMAVIAGMVGGAGLGGAVITAIQRFNVGLGFEAGLSVVVLAILLDRVTAAAGAGGLGRFKGRRRSRQDKDARQQSAESGDKSVGVHIANGP